MNCCICFGDANLIHPCRCESGWICEPCRSMLKDNLCPVCRQEYITLYHVMEQLIRFGIGCCMFIAPDFSLTIAFMMMNLLLSPCITTLFACSVLLLREIPALVTAVGVSYQSIVLLVELLK